MSSLGKSAWEFSKGASGALVLAFAAIRDPLDIAKAAGVVEQSTRWVVGAGGMQAIFAAAAFIWVFIWFHRKRVEFEATRPPEPDMPLHAALRWIARDSAWAANYPQDKDTEWVAKVDQEFRSKWKIGRIHLFGCRGDASAPIEHLVPAMKESGEFQAHNLVGDEPPTHMWSDTFRDGNGRMVVYYRVHLDSKDVKKTWPKRSRWSKLRGQSPIDRIGGYEEIFRKQDEHYLKQDGFGRSPLEVVLG